MNVEQLADDAELASRWLGRTINSKYVVQDVVGSGGMAVVYAVKHRNGKRFALKMLHRELSLNPLIRQRFVREGYVANRVEHEGAVAVIDDDITDDGSAFLVMELLHGVTLERLWEANGGRLTLGCVLAIAEQLLHVLAAAHAQDIVHRDLKPANVFLTRHGVVKILDFGIARLREGDGSKTESGTTLGTPLFMPPEQASGRSRDVDARTDLWAVGATLFSLLSGQFVHDGENAAQVLIAVATTPSRSLAQVVPDAPREVVAIIDKALAFHNEDRWDSAMTMRAAILAAQASLGITVGRDFLGEIVRATLPGSSNADVQSTPITPSTNSGPGPGNTLPFPRGPGSGPQSPAYGAVVASALPEMNATKRSALGYSASSSAPASLDLKDSSARSLDSTTAAPSFRPKSRALIGGLFAAALAVAGAILAIRFFGSAPSETQPTTITATPLNTPTPVATPPAPASSPAAEPVSLETASRPIEPARVTSVTPLRPAAGSTKPLRKPAHAGAKPSADGAAAPGNEGSVAQPAPAPTPLPPTPPSPASTGTAHKPPPILDRTSPFGK